MSHRHTTNSLKNNKIYLIEHKGFFCRDKLSLENIVEIYAIKFKGF